MKRYFNLLMVLVCFGTTAQNIDDVLRYSTNDLQGTPRFQAMGGAFGALGGDLSALYINPAGVAVFNNSLFGITGANYNRDNEANYFNSVTSTNNNYWEFNQLGGVFVFRNNAKSDWKKLAMAFNYDMVQNFDNDIVIRGNSPQGIDNYFLTAAQGVPFGSILIRDGEFIEDAYLDIGSSLGFLSQQAFLGYYGGVIDPVDPNDDNNTAYISNAQYSSVNQDYFLRTRGFNSKFSLSMGSQYMDNLYLGAAMNFHTVVYDEYKELREGGYDVASPIQFTNFDNFLSTRGTGFSFSLGAIAKLNENIRIGGSYQSPTWYRLTDDTSQRINSDLADSDIGFIDFNIVNLFQRYTIKTPGKVTGSLALVFGKDGLFSFDYEYQDMSQAELRPSSDPSFSIENQFISGELGGVSTYRIGGEYRIERVSLRGGYRFQDSPFRDGGNNSGGIGDLKAYSGGIGYSFGPSRLDLGFSRTEQDVNQRLFSFGLTNSAAVNQVNTNVTLGYTVNF
ncbi:outer membrane protein transport protein [Flavobacteriaceae bacterium D16]|nr:outer membrane protein transport protein [Flavobacteriaceae bacterium D16]